MDISSDSSSSSDDSMEGDAIIISVIEATVQFVTHQIESSTIKRTRTYINRDREAANQLLVNDYFIDDPLYDEKTFRRRFRMRRALFLRIVGDMEHEYDFFQQRYDARGRLGFTPLQKCTSAIRQLGYGTSSDSWDEYLKMSSKVSRDSVYNFCEGVIHLYGKKYLRQPNWADIQRIYNTHLEVHVFPGMLGSIDCMHWDWETCPNAWRGQHHRGHHAHPTNMLEAVASNDLWIWHAFFGVPGANNDLNVLDQSPVFDDIIDGIAPPRSFYVDDTLYKYGYYLGDGIYPEYATIVKSFTCPNEDDEKRCYFKKRQESARKDVERAFGVLKKNWHIIKNPARAWTKDKIRNAMYACLILHNMIIEDKGRAICQYYEDDDTLNVEIDIEEKRENKRKVRNRETHNNLKADLVEYIWMNRRV